MMPFVQLIFSTTGTFLFLLIYKKWPYGMTIFISTMKYVLDFFFQLQLLFDTLEKEFLRELYSKVKLIQN